MEDKNIVRNFANRFKITLMAKTAIDENQQRLARYAKALGHPIRVAIMNFLAEQDTCFFGEIHESLPIAKATASQHLKELKEAGLIQGEIMPPKVKYCINRDSWQEAKNLFSEFFGKCLCSKKGCCK